MRGLHVERAGAGPDLVLLHGWGMHSGAWMEVLPTLARRFRVHAVDLPGHGRSADEPATTLDAAALAVAGAIPAGAVVCGWSLGGIVAQRLACLRPAAARALVLVSTTPCFAQRPGWTHAMDAATLEGFAAGLSGAREATLARFVRLNALGGERGREAIRAFEARLQAHGAPSGANLAAALAWLRDADLREAAGSLPPECRVVHGDRDRVVPPQAGRWLARNAPRARLFEVAGAAHLPFFTHPQAFLAALEGLDG